MSIKFKYPYLEEEFNGVEHLATNQKIDPRLRWIIKALSYYVAFNFKKDILITHIHRTQQEQDDIYKDNPKYRIKPWKSPHQFGRGCDIRISGFTARQIRKIKAYVINNFPYGGKRFKSMIVHKLPEGAMHGHLQVRYE